MARQVAVKVGYLPATGYAHGRTITTANTGHLAYYDAGLGRTLLDSDLVSTSATTASAIAANGVISKRLITSDVFDIDVPDVVLRGCKVLGAMRSTYGGLPWRAEYCTADCTNATTWVSQDSAGWGGVWDFDHCRLFGASDGLRGTDADRMVNCHVRTFCRASDAHSDGYQWYDPGDPGNKLVRAYGCNIDCRPTGPLGAANAALFAADGGQAGSVWEWRDNWLAGGVITLRCNDGGSFKVTGNDFLDQTGIVDGWTPAARAPGATITEWSNNRVVSPGGALVTTISQPA